MTKYHSFILDDKTSKIDDFDAFIPISIHYLIENTFYDFPIYILDVDSEKFLLYCDNEHPYHAGHLQILTQDGKYPVFVPTEYSSNLNEMLTDNLNSLMDDPSLSTSQKAERFHTLSTSLMKSLFDSPPDIITFVKTAQTVSNHMGQLITSGPEVIGKLYELRTFDYYTFSHSLNVTAFTVGLYLEMNPTTEETKINELTRGVLLHDIGKCDIPKKILNKEGPLDDEEWEIMKSHTVLGYENLAADKELSEDSRLVSLHHHEAWDGMGYPDNLAKEEIPYTARICKICDVYDALTSRRSYKDKNTAYDSLKIMKENMNNQLDHEIFLIFINFLRKVFHLE